MCGVNVSRGVSVRCQQAMTAQAAAATAHSVAFRRSLMAATDSRLHAAVRAWFTLATSALATLTRAPQGARRGAAAGHHALSTSCVPRQRVARPQAMPARYSVSATCKCHNACTWHAPRCSRCCSAVTCVALRPVVCRPEQADQGSAVEHKTRPTVVAALIVLLYRQYYDAV